uniref:Uncharacterized protein n=1 Tax=Anguilla anguilla TaxID=7936 RepID=A0A0E9XAV8_ANGAN
MIHNVCVCGVLRSCLRVMGGRSQLQTDRCEIHITLSSAVPVTMEIINANMSRGGLCFLSQYVLKIEQNSIRTFLLTRVQFSV